MFYKKSSCEELEQQQGSLLGLCVFRLLISINPSLSFKIMPVFVSFLNKRIALHNQNQMQLQAKTNMWFVICIEILFLTCTQRMSLFLFCAILSRKPEGVITFIWFLVSAILNKINISQFSYHNLDSYPGIFGPFVFVCI